jgi:rifampin ADP-ribosylating transferase
MSAASPAVRRVGVRSGISMAFREQGRSGQTTVLLLHAWAESLRSFDRMVESLPQAMHVLAVDLRGHGRSDKPLDGYDLPSVADDVCAFLEAMDVPAAVVLGSSSGGYVAQQLAVLAPARVCGLVLAGSPWSLAGRPDFADDIEALVDPISTAWAREFVDWFPVGSDVPADYLADRVDDALAIPAAVWRLSLAGLTTSTPPLRSGRIAVPTLAIWGDGDALIRADDQAAMVDAIPGAQRLTYEGVGHLVLWQRPERLAGDLTAFVEALAAGGTWPESS